MIKKRFTRGLAIRISRCSKPGYGKNIIFPWGGNVFVNVNNSICIMNNDKSFNNRVLPQVFIWRGVNWSDLDFVSCGGLNIYCFAVVKVVILDGWGDKSVFNC